MVNIVVNCFSKDCDNHIIVEEDFFEKHHNKFYSFKFFLCQKCQIKLHSPIKRKITSYLKDHTKQLSYFAE